LLSQRDNPSGAKPGGDPTDKEVWGVIARNTAALTNFSTGIRTIAGSDWLVTQAQVES